MRRQYDQDGQATSTCRQLNALGSARGLCGHMSGGEARIKRGMNEHRCQCQK